MGRKARPHKYSVRHLINLIEKAQAPADMSALHAQGFDTHEILYHGTTKDLDDLQAGLGRTAHIYTSPDPNTARYYGGHIHACVGRKTKEADLTHQNALTRKVAEEYYKYFEDSFEVSDWLQQWKADGVRITTRMKREAAIECTEAMLLSGMMWERVTGARTLQDTILDEVFSMGYNCARINDVSMTGESLSVVFDKGSDLHIVDRFHANPMQRL